MAVKVSDSNHKLVMLKTEWNKCCFKCYQWQLKSLTLCSLQCYHSFPSPHSPFLSLCWCSFFSLWYFSNSNSFSLFQNSDSPFCLCSGTLAFSFIFLFQFRFSFQICIILLFSLILSLMFFWGKVGWLKIQCWFVEN